MKKLANPIRDMSQEELELAFEETSKELYEMKNTRSIDKKLDAPHQLRTLRRKKARILTIQQERKSK